MQGHDGSDEACDASGRAPQFAEESPGLEGGDGLLDQGPDLGMRPVDGLLTSGKCLPTSPVRDAACAPGASVSLVGPALDAGVREGADDAVVGGRPGRRGRHRAEPARPTAAGRKDGPGPARSSRVSCVCRSRRGGPRRCGRWAAACRPGARMPSSMPYGLPPRGLGQVRPGVRRPRRRTGRQSWCDAEPRRELGICVAVAKVGESEQGLPARAQAPPPGAELVTVSAELGGQEAQGRAGHVDARQVDKHTKPLVEMVLLVENPSTRGFTCLSAQLACPAARLERAH
jgi:hypothetical protein